MTEVSEADMTEVSEADMTGEIKRKKSRAGTQKRFECYS